MKKIYLLQEGNICNCGLFEEIKKTIKEKYTNDSQIIIEENDFKKIIKKLKKENKLHKKFIWTDSEDDFNKLSCLGLDIFEYKKNENKTEFERDLIKIYKKLSKDYLKIIKNEKWGYLQEETSKEHIEKLLIKIINNTKEFATIDKLSRLFGYIQGILVSESLINVKEERNRTRKLFKKVYKKHGYDQKTIEA